MPVPGGIGAGTIYKTGQLNATNGAYLDTLMVIYANGIGCPTDWIYMTATNRTEKGVEVLTAYNGCSGSIAELVIFDWSCSPSFPCGSETSPSFVYQKSLSQLDSCNIAFIDDGGGHPHSFVRYANTTLHPSANPTMWGNAVYLRNFCTSSWDLVYSHAFGGSQADCSLGTSCGWWGPIVETFNDPHPTTKELAFKDTLLWIGGTGYLLTGARSNWVAPPPQWPVFHRTANHTWGVGNSTDN